MCMDALETCRKFTHEVNIISGGGPVEVLSVVVSMCEWRCQCFTASVSHHAWEARDTSPKTRMREGRDLYPL
jgi:hypothetical protein